MATSGTLKEEKATDGLRVTTPPNIPINLLTYIKGFKISKKWGTFVGGQGGGRAYVLRIGSSGA
eukprot:1382730-Amorphochlora_amoeboformis.AAC.1